MEFLVILTTLILKLDDVSDLGMVTVGRNCFIFNFLFLKFLECNRLINLSKINITRSSH